MFKTGCLGLGHAQSNGHSKSAQTKNVTWGGFGIGYYSEHDQDLPTQHAAYISTGVSVVVVFVTSSQQKEQCSYEFLLKLTRYHSLI